MPRAEFLELFTVLAPPPDYRIGNLDPTFTSEDHIEIFTGFSINYGVFALFKLTKLKRLNQVSQLRLLKISPLLKELELRDQLDKFRDFCR